MLTPERIGELWDGHTLQVFGKTGINPVVFARAIEAEVRKEIEAAVFKPEFDAHSYEQERLVMEFCMEIAGKRGELGCSPDPVRLLEMANALYQAEFRASTQPAPTGAIPEQQNTPKRT